MLRSVDYRLSCEEAGAAGSRVCVARGVDVVRTSLQEAYSDLILERQPIVALEII
jgi:hypothetical protein